MTWTYDIDSPSTASGADDGILTIVRTSGGELTQTQVNAAIDAHELAGNVQTLVTLLIGATFTSLGDSAISGTGLQSIQFDPSSLVDTIGTEGLSANVALTELILPLGLVHIPSMMCAQCTSLATLDIRTNVKTIGYRAFYNCLALSSLVVPAEVTDIVDNAFESCQALLTVDFAANSELVTVGKEIFRDCTLLLTVNFPESLVLTVGTDLFLDAPAVRTLKMHKDIWPLIDASLADETERQFVTFYDSPGTVFARDLTILRDPLAHEFPITRVDDGTLELLGNGDVLPSEVTAAITAHSNQYSGSPLDTLFFGEFIQTIAASAVAGKTQLVNIRFHANSVVSAIGALAFQGCTALTGIIVPAQTIGTSVFSGCSALKTAQLTSATTLGDTVFKDCILLKNITLPDTVTLIGAKTFENCTALEKVIFPKTLSAIGADTFLQATSMRTLALLDALWTVVKESLGQNTQGITQTVSLYDKPGGYTIRWSTDGTTGNLVGTLVLIASSGGDPYIRCAQTGTTVKLPNCSDVYRMYQNPRTGSIINCQVGPMKASPQEQVLLGTWAKSIEEGYFFTKMFIYDGINKTSTTIDMTNPKVLEDPVHDWRQDAARSETGTENLFIGDYVARTVRVCDGGEVDLRLYENPSIRNDLQYLLPGNMDGLLYKNYRPKIWRRNRLNDTKLVKLSTAQRSLTRRDIVGHREVTEAVRNQRMFYEMFVK